MQGIRKCFPRGPNSIQWIRGTVLALVFAPDGTITRRITGRNIITNAGDLYYAQMACGESPTNDFDHATTAGLRLGTGSTTPAKADTDVETFVTDAKVKIVSGYEKTNDLDANNSGSGTDIVTWKYTWTEGDFTGSGINEGAIVDDITTPTAALCHFLFAASFNVIATDKLTVFVNHEMLGA